MRKTPAECVRLDRSDVGGEGREVGEVASDDLFPQLWHVYSCIVLP